MENITRLDAKHSKITVRMCLILEPPLYLLFEQGAQPYGSECYTSLGPRGFMVIVYTTLMMPPALTPPYRLPFISTSAEGARETTMPGTIHVTISNSPLQISRGIPIELEFVDRSGCKLAASLFIPDIVEADFDFKHALESNFKSKYKPYGSPGQRKCGVSFRAFTHPALLGRTYDLEMFVNSTLIARINGSVPSGADHDHGFGDFILEIV